MLEVDLELEESTAGRHVNRIKRFLSVIGKDPRTVTREELRAYLKTIKKNVEPSTYKNELASLKRFYRDYLGMEHVVSSFKFPQRSVKPIHVPDKEQLQEFYNALKTARDRALFLIYATSGLRNSEVIGLNRFEDIDFEKRMIKPQQKNNESKHVWLSFYNKETERALKEYLGSREDLDPRLFPISKRHVLRTFKAASEATDIKITPQKMRDWFCSEMGELGVQDRYVDAFCGRVPQSVLAKHYTDYSPMRLKRIYDKAGLRVLS